MPTLETLPATAPIGEILAVLRRDSALILKDVLAPDEVARVLGEPMPFIDATEFGRDDFTGRKTTRTGALIARSAGCREMVANKTIAAAAEEFLKPFCERIQLHLTQVIVDVEKEFFHFAIMNVQAIVLGIHAQEMRVRTHRRLIRMRANANIRERNFPKLSHKHNSMPLRSARTRQRPSSWPT